MTDSPVLDSLRGSFVEVERGAWWVLYEKFTRWSDTRPYHPWLVTYASPRNAFYHGMPRSKGGRPPDVEHGRHLAGHEPMCYLDLKGWVILSGLRQLRDEWFDRPNWYSCTEPEGSDLLAQIDEARRVN